MTLKKARLDAVISKMEPDGFRIREDLKGVIYSIDPEATPAEMTRLAEMNAERVLNEWAASDPRIAAEQRKRKKELAAWKRERNKWADEVGLLQAPFLAAALSGPNDDFDRLCAVLRISDWLFSEDAPKELTHDLFSIARALLPNEGTST